MRVDTPGWYVFSPPVIPGKGLDIQHGYLTGRNPLRTIYDIGLDDASLSGERCAHIEKIRQYLASNGTQRRAQEARGWLDVTVGGI